MALGVAFCQGSIICFREDNQPGNLRVLGVADYYRLLLKAELECD